MVDFINGRSYIGQDTSLGQVRGVINGDLGFSSPSATNAIGFAVGAEYRKYGYTLSPDSLAQVPGELGGGGGAVLPYVGGYSVKEVFGEINAPLVEDKPFFELLSVEAGIRQSKYSNTAPNSPSFNATTWKVGGTWSPTSDLKIRGGYQHAVRAPSIGELFAPSVTGLTNLADDPCSGSKPTGNAILSAVCIAQGAAAGQLLDSRRRIQPVVPPRI
jgi:outer membrane receptor protein involved in Fe transport